MTKTLQTVGHRGVWLEANTLLMAILCLGTAACTGSSDTASLSLEQSVAAPQSQMIALAATKPATPPPPQAIASLPSDAGTTRSVRVHGYVDGYRQDILLDGNAIRSIPNSVTILVRTSHQATLDDATPLFKPTEAAIRVELGNQFPNIAMQVATRDSNDNYGPYGLALGRAESGSHCLYMWQWIDEDRVPADLGVSGPVSIRIRLCRDNTNFDAMAAWVDRLSISRAVTPGDSVGIVEGPTDTGASQPAPHKKLKRLATHRVRSFAEARRDPAREDPGPVAPGPVAAEPSTPAPLSTDLPPEAYLGPKAGRGAAKTN